MSLLPIRFIIIIIIITSLFKEDIIFVARTNLTYGPHKTRIVVYNIYIDNIDNTYIHVYTLKMII